MTSRGDTVRVDTELGIPIAKITGEQRLDNRDSSYALEREYIRASSLEPVWIRITYPVQRASGHWTAYLHFYGFEPEVVPVTQVDFFETLVAAADVAHHILAPFEEDLIYCDQQGTSGFPRHLGLLVSKEALAKIDKIIAEEPPKKLKTVDVSKLNTKPY